MRVALGLFVLIAGSVLLIAWKEGETFSGRFDYVLNYGNPFEGEQELQALQAYLASTSISEGTGETSLNHLIEKKKPVVLLFFQPLDCHVCLGYMREMWEVANDTRGQNEVQAVMLAYNSNPTELQSLAKNWEYPDPLFLVDRPHPAAWATPFIAILDREGNVVFANAIINSSERQALLMQAYHDQVSRLAGSKLPDVP